MWYIHIHDGILLSHKKSETLPFAAIRIDLEGIMCSQVGLAVNKQSANAGNMRHRFDPWVSKIPWRRAWQPTPVFLPGESHRQRSLAGYGP